MKFLFSTFYFFTLSFFLFFGCSFQQVERQVSIPFVDAEPITHTYIGPSTYLPKKVALLPLGYEKVKNTSTDKGKEKLIKEAQKIVRNSFYGELKLLPFGDVELEKVDKVFTELSLVPKGVLNRNEIKKICDALGVDGIISGQLTKATNLTDGVYAETIVAAQLWFWNREGELLWTSDHQEAFRGGIYDVGQAVNLVVNQMENRDSSRAFQRRATWLSRKMAATLPAYWMNSALIQEDSANSLSAEMEGILVLPLTYKKPAQKEGADFLSSQLAAALVRKGIDVKDKKQTAVIFKNEDFHFFSAPRLSRKARSEGIEYILLGEVEKWQGVYGVIHSHVDCAFKLELWDARTGRRIFSDHYDKKLAAGLIKGPTSLVAVVSTPVTGMQKKRSYQNASDLIDKASARITQLLEHRKQRENKKLV